MAVDRAGIPGEEELQILRQLVQLVALAVEALRSYAEEHLVALTLQRSLLPAALPEVPGPGHVVPLHPGQRSGRGRR